jgi:hypothetical protein
MRKQKLVADEQNLFRRHYNRHGRHHKQLIREEWARLFHPHGTATSAFANRVDGRTIAPEAEVEWIKGVDPIQLKQLTGTTYGTAIETGIN